MKWLITHTDLDGVGNIVVSSYYNINFVRVITSNYGNNEEEHMLLLEMTSDDEVIYTDFTPDEESQKLIMENGIKCKIFDHHETQVENINNFCKEYPYAEYIFNTDICGTKIYYQYLLNNGFEGNKVLSEFVELVDTYDMWRKGSPLWEKAQNLNRLLFKVVSWQKKGSVEMYEFFIKGILYKCANNTSYEFNEFEQKKIDSDIKQENDLFDEFVNGKRQIKTRKDEKGDYFAVIKCEKKLSIICNRILDKWKKLSYVIAINEYDKENPKVSIRCREGKSVLNLEGVKGHNEAGGVENITKELVEQLWTNKKNLKRID